MGFLGYQYLLSNRIKRGVSGKLTSQNLGTQQTKGNYDVDWIPKHHLVQSKLFIEKIFILDFIYLDRSPKKSSRERKSRQTNEVNGTGAASSENDD